MTPETDESAKRSAAVAEYDATMAHLGSCGDGNCLILRQKGMHTNGGCRCWKDHMKAQHVMIAAFRLRAALGEKP